MENFQYVKLTNQLCQDDNSVPYKSHFVMLISGACGTGKSNFIHNLLKIYQDDRYEPYFDNIIVLCGEQTSEYNNRVDNVYHIGLNTDQTNNMFEKLIENGHDKYQHNIMLYFNAVCRLRNWKLEVVYKKLIKKYSKYFDENVVEDIYEIKMDDDEAKNIIRNKKKMLSQVKNLLILDDVLGNDFLSKRNNWYKILMTTYRRYYISIIFSTQRYVECPKNSRLLSKIVILFEPTPSQFKVISNEHRINEDDVINCYEDSKNCKYSFIEINDSIPSIKVIYPK
ncbi:MAG: hypothetical protein GQ557_01440 [Mycoplasmataceae bacterium]|nr:hypothetical protein [Mycoplasmataceae bacterium]